MKKPTLSIFNGFRKGLHSDPKFIYYAYTSWYIANTSLPTNVNDLTIFDEATIHDPESGAWGIHAFNAVIWHEYEHVAIKNEQWPGNIYDKSLDVDNDYYNDIWEETDSLAIANNFKVRVQPNNGIDKLDKYSIDLFNGFMSNGYKFEEKRCRSFQVKKYLEGKCDNFDHLDWSYEREIVRVKAQGKNWLK
ncbi:MAG: hypothetical protein IPO72_08180 [Saprospiraceae bacterium]|nr:hypothetical protein [Candidatus Vicinibacter affinis]MBK8643602.1 hypothetical protein [Candidatus Vicinibacter affinis]MBK9641257.1 hypothetical protein [Candidatus Vicinibacter affinis]